MLIPTSIQKAIVETIAHFAKYPISIESDELLNTLKEEISPALNTLSDYKNLFEQGRLEDLKKEMIQHYDNAVEAVIKENHFAYGLKDISVMPEIHDWAICKFWALFHDQLIKHTSFILSEENYIAYTSITIENNKSHKSDPNASIHRSKCTTTEFKMNLVELCEDCPNKQIILINNQNLTQRIEETKTVSVPEIFRKVLNKEMEEAQAGMTKMIQQYNSNKEWDTINQFTGNISLVYIRCKEKLKILNQYYLDLQPMKTSRIKVEKSDKEKFSLRQTAMALFVMGITLNEENAESYLKKYTDLKSVPKFLSKRFSSSEQITNFDRETTKTANTKHLNDLKAAKRLISGEKNDNALKLIGQYLQAFQSSYNLFY